MSSFRYCSGCGAGLNEPTADEDLESGYDCPQCGETQNNFYTVEEWVVRLSNELREARVEIEDLKKLSHRPAPTIELSHSDQSMIKSHMLRISSGDESV